MNPLTAKKSVHEPLAHHCETADGKPFDVQETDRIKGAWIGLGSPDHCLCLVSEITTEGQVMNYVGLHDPAARFACRAAISANPDGSYTVQLADGDDVRHYDLDELVRHAKSLPPRPA